ncbi:MAG: hypothetical protein ACMG6S_21415, partial [Byssovorax sp.]
MAAPNDPSVRIPIILTKTMNTTAILHNDELLQSIDPIDLKLVLLWLAQELRWLLTLGASVGGFSPPPDAVERIERLCSSLGESNIADPLTADEL